MIEILCKRKLAEERRTINGAPEWRRDEDGCPLGLFITNGGLLALGVDDTERPKASQAAARMPRQRKTAAAKPRGKPRKASPTGSKRRAAPSQSKQDVVIQMLKRHSGVTIEDIIAKTGWQPHSVRGFFSGLVKRSSSFPLSPTWARTACAATTSRPSRRPRRKPWSHRPLARAARGDVGDLAAQRGPLSDPYGHGMKSRTLRLCVVLE